MTIKRTGFFLALEGIDLVGKTTQKMFIAEWFKAAGFDVVLTREPGGTPLAEEIRELLLAPREEPVDAMTETMLFFASRRQHLTEVILPSLAEGKIVITDRFVDSTYAYQSAGGGVDEASIDTLTHLVVSDNQPDMTFLLTMSYEDAKLRAAERGTPDRIEGNSSEYYDKAKAAYLKRASKYPERYTVIDASVSIEQVQAQILPILMQIVNDLRQRASVNS